MLKQKVYLILLLQLFTVTFANAAILSAEGQGENLNEAKASALSALSQLIISKVESSFKSDVSVSGDDVSRNMQSVKKIASGLTLKGVQYVNESKDANGISITAVLDQTGVNSTLDFMKSKLELDFSLLNKAQKKEALEYSEQLTAFVSILPASAMLEFKNIKSWSKNKREELLKHLNQGRVEFISRVANFQVTIDNKSVDNGEFLDQGNYAFEANADGYRSLTGQFAVSTGETVKVKLPFIQTIGGKQIALVIPTDYSYLKSEIVTILSDLGITHSAKATNSLELKIKDKINQVDEYAAHNIKLRVVASKNDNVFKKVTLKQKFIVENNDKFKVEETITALAKKGVIGLMSRMDLDNYF